MSLRSRQNKITNANDFILTTDGFQSNEKEDDIRLVSKRKHNKIHIFFLILTTLFYFLHTLSAYLPMDIQLTPDILLTFSTRPITRVYTTDLRPNIVIENLVLRLAENWQAFWLIYILTLIPRYHNTGYVYRHPNIFNIYHCCLLLLSLILRIFSQSFSLPSISCSCLCLSYIALCITCRHISIQLTRYENFYRKNGLSIDFLILNYFLLNSLFFYTTSIGYITICACIEYIGIYLELNLSILISTTICTTIGLTIVYSFVIVYIFLDFCIYTNEFRSIWITYIFSAYMFICPPLRQFSLLETNNYNHYLIWIIFLTNIFMLIIRLYRLIFEKRNGRMRKKIRINSNIEEITSGN